MTDVHGGSNRRNATCVSGRSMIVPPSACDKLTQIHSNPILCSKALSTTARRPYFHTSENPNTNHWSKTVVKRFGALVLCAASGDDWIINKKKQSRDCCAPILALSAEEHSCRALGLLRPAKPTTPHTTDVPPALSTKLGTSAQV